MKVEQSGWYKTRDGRLAEVVVSPFEREFPVFGYVLGVDDCTWTSCGEFDPDTKNGSLDLVEYLGKERPKERKTVRMAPALCREKDGSYFISTAIYEDSDMAEYQENRHFVRWLIDTPMAVDVEVQE